MARSLSTLSILMASAPAAASDVGARGVDRHAMEMMESFAACAVKRQPETVRAALLAKPRTIEKLKLFDSISSSRLGCLKQAGTLRMKERDMRGALAEQIYRLDFPDAVVQSVQPDAVFTQREGVDPLMDYGACIALRDPAASDTLVKTKAGSEAEHQAIGALQTALSSCLAADQTMRINPSIIRGVVAEALYHQRKGDQFAYVSNGASN